MARATWNTYPDVELGKHPLLAAVAWGGATVPAATSQERGFAATAARRPVLQDAKIVPSRPCRYGPAGSRCKPSHKRRPGETRHKFLFISRLDDWPGAIITVSYFMVLIVPEY